MLQASRGPNKVTQALARTILFISDWISLSSRAPERDIMLSLAVGGRYMGSIRGCAGEIDRDGDDTRPLLLGPFIRPLHCCFNDAMMARK